MANKKIRIDKICKNCGHHTKQIKTKYGWKCIECNLIYRGGEDERKIA